MGQVSPWKGPRVRPSPPPGAPASLCGSSFAEACPHLLPHRTPSFPKPSYVPALANTPASHWAHSAPPHKSQLLPDPLNSLIPSPHWPLSPPLGPGPSLWSSLSLCRPTLPHPMEPHLFSVPSLSFPPLTDPHPLTQPLCRYILIVSLTGSGITLETNLWACM